MCTSAKTNEPGAASVESEAAAVLAEVEDVKAVRVESAERESCDQRKNVR